MKTIKFTVPGRVEGKKRPRHFKQGSRIITWQPKKGETHIAQCAKFQAMRGISLMKGPLRLSVSSLQRPPERWSRKKKENTLYVTGRPDCDNIVKTICDALNKIVWHDDAQIASLWFDRQYSTTRPEHVEIVVTELE